MKTIKVLGSGCSSARSAAALIREVAAARQVAIQLEEDCEQERIAALGVMIDGQVVLAGGVPDWIEVERWLTEAAAGQEQ